MSPLPLVYACSGPSQAAQFAHQMAVKLDGLGLARMSCPAGVAGGVPSLVALAHSGRPIIAIDGCPLACVKCSLGRAGLVPERHYQLQHHWVKRRKDESFDAVAAAGLLERLCEALSPGGLRPLREISPDRPLHRGRGSHSGSLT